VRDIARAAEQALEELTLAKKDKVGDRSSGRPGDQLQKDLGEKLGQIYTNLGGSLARRVHATEYGPFHEFLAIVLPIVRDHASKAKSSLTITSIVRFAQASAKADSASPH
jgi:hypothetical protein